MNPRIKNLAGALAITCVWLLLPGITQAHRHTHDSSPVAATPAPQASQPAAATSAPGQQAAEASQPATDDEQDDAADDTHGRQLVSIGHDALLPAGEQAEEVVSVFGSSTSHGQVSADVVSVLGDTTVTGQVGGDAVAVLGDNLVDGEVNGDVVTVLGRVTLGPHAHVHGQLVDVLGTVTRDPAAVVDGGVQSVLPGMLPSVPGTQAWFRHGLFFGRPLFIEPAVGLIWGIAAVLLVLYVIIALLFHDAVEHCVGVLRRYPGRSLLTAVLACIITPLLLFLLLCTVIGIPAIPVVGLGLLCATLFGKSVVLSWLGQRGLALARPQGAEPAAANAIHSAAAVLIGGILVTLVYLVPVLGMLVFLVLSMLGYGAVLYSLLERMRASHAPAIAATAPAATSAADAGSSPAATGTQAPETTPATPLHALPRAGFWIRIGALLIDLVLVSVVLSLLGGWHEDGRLHVVALAVYGGLMWKLKGTTVGGIVCDLHVIREDGREFDWSTAIVRALGCLLSMAALGLGFIWIAVDPGRQAWHDKLAGTIVVRKPRGTPAP